MASRVCNLLYLQTFSGLGSSLFVLLPVKRCRDHFTCFYLIMAVWLPQSLYLPEPRILKSTPHCTKHVHVLASICWLPECFRMHFKILLITFKTLHAPCYISDLSHHICQYILYKNCHLKTVTVTSHLMQTDETSFFQTGGAMTATSESQCYIWRAWELLSWEAVLQWL